MSFDAAAKILRSTSKFKQSIRIVHIYVSYLSMKLYDRKILCLGSQTALSHCMWRDSSNACARNIEAIEACQGLFDLTGCFNLRKQPSFHVSSCGHNSSEPTNFGVLIADPGSSSGETTTITTRDMDLHFVLIGQV
ncbi:hypothetical protein BOTNAR_0200g00050 [Botryotinia narcissicola]|uniref:Uncharacterized protein n=1 Tax=Botryotinia narcissicola TaxID=278944 RepID=A0A4Z1I7A1_9HELO|nr:hypothetical protein BOTNAR_0200g00050 [Botryotinia narcissicola]